MTEAKKPLMVSLRWVHYTHKVKQAPLTCYFYTNCIIFDFIIMKFDTIAVSLIFSLLFCLPFQSCQLLALIEQHILDTIEEKQLS